MAVPPKVKRTPIRMLRPALLVAGILSIVLQSCGGSSVAQNQSTAGQPNTASICEDGDTRQCVGPGACDGGQLCRHSEWEPCDCGGGRSTGSGGTTTGGGRSSGDAGARPADGVGGTQEAEGGNTAAGGNGDEANIDWNDDPCSQDGIVNDLGTIDCAGDCNGNHPRPSQDLGCAPRNKCELTAVEIFAPIELGDWLKAPTTFVHRTPRAETVDGPCDCTSGQPAFAKYRVHVALKDAGAVHLDVRPPWHFSSDIMSGCADQPAQCVSRTGTWDVLLWTEYSNAPAVNVKLSAGTCN